MNFNYYMPVRIFCGRDCLVKNVDYISSFGKRAIVVTGKRSAKNGALADIASAFEKAGMVPEMAEVTMKALNETELSGEDAERMQRMIDALEDLDDVQQVYTTAVFND